MQTYRHADMQGCGAVGIVPTLCERGRSIAVVLRDFHYFSPLFYWDLIGSGQAIVDLALQRIFSGGYLELEW